MKALMLFGLIPLLAFSLETSPVAISFAGFHLQEGGMDDTAFSAKVDEKTFSFRFEVHDSTMVVTDVLKEEFDTAYEDRVEVYIAPVADRSKPYFCLEVDAKGRILDYRVDPTDKFDFKWNFKSAKAEPEALKGGYAVSCQVDRKELESLGIDFSEYYLAVFRADLQVAFGTKNGPPIKWYSAMPPPSKTAHFHQSGHFFLCRNNQMFETSIANRQKQAGSPGK